MGLFDGVLLVSDLDGTLLDENENVSDENVEALEYFKAEGGILTFASGRNVENMNVVTNVIMPSAPMIADNGSLIYDVYKKKYILKRLLYDDALPVAHDIAKHFPASSLEVYKPEQVYICSEHQDIKRPDYFVLSAVTDVALEKIPFPWSKVVFMQSKEETNEMRRYIMSKTYYNNYNFFKSDDCFYELLNKNASKGHAVSYLKGIIPGIKLTVAVGDNENDISLIKAADIGYATENASRLLKAVANKFTNHHTKSALACVVKEIEEMCLAKN